MKFHVKSHHKILNTTMPAASLMKH